MKNKIQKCSEDRELSQTRPKPNAIDRPVRTVHTVCLKKTGPLRLNNFTNSLHLLLLFVGMFNILN